MLKKTHQIIVILALIGSIIAAFYFWQKYDTLKNNPEKVAQDEAKQIVAKLGQLAILPQGEEPTVATVTEPEKLKNQPFFVRAEKGDKLLIYNVAGKAYLYRPGIGKIIDATSFNPNQVLEQPPKQAGEPQTVAATSTTEEAKPSDKKSKAGN